MAGRWLLVAGLVAAAAVLPDLRRPGYSPDEEFTQFAVRGIHASGLPLLPSGLLYDRGLAYSYASALVSDGQGSLLPARLVSLAAAAGALAVLFVELRRVAGPTAAALAAALAGASLPFWVSATTARFYAPFLLCHLALLAALGRLSVSWKALAVVAAIAAAARWTHELAFTLAVVPVVAALLTRGHERRAWIVRAVAVGAGLAAGQAAILALHAAAPPSNGDVMVRRFFVWQVLNLLERPPLGARGDAAGRSRLRYGRGADAGRAARPRRPRRRGAAGRRRGRRGARADRRRSDPVHRRRALAARARRAGCGPPASACWPRAPVSGSSRSASRGCRPAEAAQRTVAAGTVYPLDMFAHLLRETPLLTVATLAALLARLAGLGGAWSPIERGAARRCGSAGCCGSASSSRASPRATCSCR